VRRLGLSEDEACRRIDVARLARRYPALFPRLATGEISLTVAAVLKPHIAEDNQHEVLAAVTGKTVQQAREALAVLFPRPDVAPSVRKLPERRAVPSGAASASETVPAQVLLGETIESTSEATPLAAPSARVEHSASLPTRIAPSAPTRIAPPPIEPLSEARYRVQFTARTALKEKLDQARDLMRHRNPSGDIAPIVERALDLLLDQLMKERFGATQKPRSSGAVTSRHVTNAARRAVLERDDLQCSWVDAQGRRCESRAWLELDHRHPRAKGGGSEPENLRVLCRAHDRFAAEQAYGRATVEAAIARRRQAAACAPGHAASIGSQPGARSMHDANSESAGLS
jgi:hypothetical protein